ncbi:unnamed protein product [Amoebophrya sp. A120]|nr:unnamed protein product [Amoebophrya sp. A120]|eukprot:GSA120T00003486001.1
MMKQTLFLACCLAAQTLAVTLRGGDGDKKAALERWVEGYINAQWDNGDEPEFHAKVTDDGNLLVDFLPDQKTFSTTHSFPYQNYHGLLMHFKIMIPDGFSVPEGWNIYKDPNALQVRLPEQPQAYAKFKTFHAHINNSGTSGRCCFKISEGNWQHYSLHGWIDRLWEFLVHPDAGTVDTPYDPEAQRLWRRWIASGAEAAGEKADASYWRAVGEMAIKHHFKSDLNFPDEF